MGGITLNDIEREARNILAGNKQMTRQEAENKLKEVFDTKGPAKELIYWLPSALEALGLIKLEEEKIIASPSAIIKNRLEGVAHSPMLKADEIVNALMQSGYKIVRKDHG